MTIPQNVEWDGKKYQRFIDVETELDYDCLSVTKEVLGLMVVLHTSAFKVPIGYIFIDGLEAVKMSNLIWFVGT